MVKKVAKEKMGLEEGVIVNKLVYSFMVMSV